MEPAARPRGTGARASTPRAALGSSLRFRVHGKECDVGPGESITIPAGAPHHFWNPGDEDAHAIGFFTPSLKTAAFFETYFALAHAGDLDQQGMPSLFQLAVMLPAFEDEIRPTSPCWPLLKTTTILIAPIAKLRGYRATHPYPQDLTTTSAVAAS